MGNQEKEKSIEQYVTKLRKLSEFCEYGDQRENEIRDQLIASCSSSRFRKKMLETADLTLARAVQIGQLMENVHHQTSTMEQRGATAGPSTASDDQEYMNFLQWKWPAAAIKRQ